MKIRPSPCQGDGRSGDETGGMKTAVIPVLIAAVTLAASAAFAGKTIVWDKSTLVEVQRGGGYPRMIRLKGGDILACFELRGKVCVKRSADEGKTWDGFVEVAGVPSGSASNPELLQLANGWVLLMYNERPKDGVHRFSIHLSVSTDGGRAWRAHSLAYEADTVWDNGCWEPAAIQLPSGEIQLFFANENPYRESAEQEISLVRSFDNGRTWSKAKAISFRPNHRDGMPSPLMLQGGKGLVVAVEDNGYSVMFHPVIVHSSVEDNWKSRAASGGSPRRWRAVKAPLSSEWGGAPYIRQMPGGETVLSFQSSVGRKLPQIVVYVGDENARNFEGRSVPFEIKPEDAAWWNSLFVKNEPTITAFSQCNGGVWAIDGRIVDAL